MGEQIIGRGDTLLVPADSGPVTMQAESGTRALVSWVPDLAADILEAGLSEGVSADDLVAAGGHESHNDLLALLKR
jgi:hypothetical protein